MRAVGETPGIYKPRPDAKLFSSLSLRNNYSRGTYSPSNFPKVKSKNHTPENAISPPTILSVPSKKPRRQA